MSLDLDLSIHNKQKPEHYAVAPHYLGFPRVTIKLFLGYWLTWLLSIWAWLSSPLIIRQRTEIQYQLFDYQVIWHYHSTISDSDVQCRLHFPIINLTVKILTNSNNLFGNLLYWTIFLLHNCIPGRIKVWRCRSEGMDSFALSQVDIGTFWVLHLIPLSSKILSSEIWVESQFLNGIPGVVFFWQEILGLHVDCFYWNLLTPVLWLNSGTVLHDPVVVPLLSPPTLLPHMSRTPVRANRWKEWTLSFVRFLWRISFLGSQETGNDEYHLLGEKLFFFQKNRKFSFLMLVFLYGGGPMYVHGNRRWRTRSELSFSTRLVCAQTSLSITCCPILFLLFEWIRPSIDQQWSLEDTEHTSPQTLSANQTSSFLLNLVLNTVGHTSPCQLTLCWYWGLYDIHVRNTQTIIVFANETLRAFFFCLQVLTPLVSVWDLNWGIQREPVITFYHTTYISTTHPIHSHESNDRHRWTNVMHAHKQPHNVMHAHKQPPVTEEDQGSPVMCQARFSKSPERDVLMSCTHTDT